MRTGSPRPYRIYDQIDRGCVPATPRTYALARKSGEAKTHAERNQNFVGEVDGIKEFTSTLLLFERLLSVVEYDTL